MGFTAFLKKSLGAGFIVGVLAALIMASGLPTKLTTNASANDCDNAVIFCGGSTGQLQGKYFSGDGRNSAASIQHIFGWFGISSGEMSVLSRTGQEGTVTKSGDVFIGGRLVATNALTGGRDCSPGGTPHNVGGTGFCSRPPSVNFLSNSLSAVVVMQNGVFKFAVLHSCGNPVIGHPTTSPPKPTPKPTPPKPAPKPTPPTPAPKPTPPAPAPTPTQNTTVQQSSVTVCNGNTTNVNTGVAAQGGNCSVNTVNNAAPSPSAQCASLQVQVSQDNQLSITATVNSSLQNGAQLQSTTFNFGDGTSVTTTDTTVTHTFAQAGTFTITANQAFSTGTQNTTSACQAQITVSQPGQPSATVTTSSTPTTPSTPTQTPSTNLVNTGPGSVIGVFAGATLFGALFHSLFLSRRWSRT